MAADADAGDHSMLSSMGSTGCRGGDRGREDEELGEAQVGKSMEGCTDCGSSRQGQGCEKNRVQV